MLPARITIEYDAGAEFENEARKGEAAALLEGCGAVSLGLLAAVAAGSLSAAERDELLKLCVEVSDHLLRAAGVNEAVIASIGSD